MSHYSLLSSSPTGLLQNISRPINTSFNEGFFGLIQFLESKSFKRAANARPCGRRLPLWSLGRLNLASSQPGLRLLCLWVVFTMRCLLALTSAGRRHLDCPSHAQLLLAAPELSNPARSGRK
ncbi:hypothetical protein J6590_016313 [Homalodisca vitripennis]|nr:hypothetical protein J6590_016313 [Homalodisca vitripennis]